VLKLASCLIPPGALRRKVVLDKTLISIHIEQATPKETGYE